MPCYHPLKAFTIGTTPNGKRLLKVVPYSVDYLSLVDRNGKQTIEKCTGPEFFGQYDVRHYNDFVTIPCGHCIGCRFDYSREWANRMLLESLDHESNYFITLTYNDESLISHCRKELDIKTDNISSVNSIKEYSYSLNKRDFQLFMKRLRKRFPEQKIRFYACGEYGSETMRPHYHAILFGLKLPDLKLYKVNFRGDRLYNSQILSEIWPFGYSVVSEVTWNTCAYVARYVTKKLSGPLAEFYETFNLEPEFALMSRKPGLAHKFFDEHKDEIYESAKIMLSHNGKYFEFRPPKFFDALYDVENPERLLEVKEGLRVQAENAVQLKLSRTDLPYLDYLAVEEYNFTHRVKSLRRCDV